MKKLILIILLTFLSFCADSTFAQTIGNKTAVDQWGTFCLVVNSANDSNYYQVDLSQFTNEFEKVYFKNYFSEQDVFNSRMLSYNIIENKAIIAVPQKYKIEDFRHFMANMKKMTNTANYNWSINQKNEYLLNHKLN